MITEAEIADPAKIERFIYAGNALFTLQSKVSGKHFTYRVKKAPDADRWFASTRAGPKEWMYIGMVDSHGILIRTRASKCGHDSPSFTALSWFLQWIKLERKKPESVTFMHAGRCCRCGRKLTNPESIRDGIGPECAGKES